MTSQDQRNSPTAGLVTDREEAVANSRRGRRNDVIIAEDVLEERLKPFVDRNCCRIEIGTGPPRLVVIP